jgi:hypothetical protein
MVGAPRMYCIAMANTSSTPSLFAARAAPTSPILPRRRMAPNRCAPILHGRQMPRPPRICDGVRQGPSCGRAGSRRCRYVCFRVELITLSIKRQPRVVRPRTARTDGDVALLTEELKTKFARLSSQANAAGLTGVVRDAFIGHATDQCIRSRSDITSESRRLISNGVSKKRFLAAKDRPSPLF